MKNRDFNFAETFKKLCFQLEWNQEMAAIKLKKSLNSINNWVNGRSVPHNSQDIIEKLEELLNNSTLVHKPIPAYDAKKSPLVLEPFPISSLRQVPFFEFRNLPNNMTFQNALQVNHQQAYYVTDHRTEFAFKMFGQSMQPSINDSDVLFAASVTLDALEPNRFYLVCTATQRMVRRLGLVTPTHLILIAENTSELEGKKVYPDEKINRKDIIDIALITEQRIIR